MNHVSALIERCSALGATLTPFGDRLKVRAPEPLPSDLLVALKEAKPLVMAELLSRTARPIIWKGTSDEYRQALVVFEAEVVLAKAQLTGDPVRDWYARNRILDLEMKIGDLNKWLVETNRESCQRSPGHSGKEP